MTKTILAAVLLLLTGCVSYNTMLVNKQGQTTRCAGWAFGWATPIEMAQHHDCMKKAQAAGYVEAGSLDAPKVETQSQ